MQVFLNSIIKNSFIIAAAIVILFDMVLGVLRAIKEKKFNSSAGINGAIRKVTMLVCIVSLALIDTIVHIDLLFMIPKEYLSYIGISKMGLCEFFALIFTLFEFASVLKNMVLCGLPVPKRLKDAVTKFLNDMTTEMPNKREKPIIKLEDKQ